MNFSSEEKSVLSYLRHLEATFQDENSNPSKSADAYRSLFLHFRERDVSSNKSPVPCSSADIYLDKYEGVVDRMDDLGLNNFAEGALALCNYHKNESAKWKTTLNVDKILQLCDEEDDHSDAESDEDPDVTLRDPTKKLEPMQQGGQIQSPKPLFKSTAPFENQPQSVINQPQSTFNNTFGSARDESNNPCHGKSPLQSPLSHWTATIQPRENASNGDYNGFRAGDGYGNRQQQSSMLNFCQPESVSRSSNMMFDAPNQGNRMGARQITGGVFGATGNAVRMYPDERDRVDVKPEKIGGPYANFGQKRKNSTNQAPQWNSRNSKRWGNKIDEEDEEAEEDQDNNKATPFRTAREQFVINQHKKHGSAASRDQSAPVYGGSYGAVKKSLGTRRGPASKFVPPILNKESDDDGPVRSERKRHTGGGSGGGESNDPDEPVDERLKGIDPKMIELINNEIMDTGAQITWDDIAGLEFAKKTIKEIVVWPMLRPDIFTGLRGPPKGLLLFGPPGTGKTLIGKCIASQSKSTFFCISASSLTSKWVGEGEKMVRALFAVARVEQPSVVFIDEIDSLLSQRSDSEHESSRRIKTEFLVQLDGAATGSEDRILVIGATNRPQEIDEAARRRFVKRLLIPLPESVARRQIVVNLMSQQRADLSEDDINTICNKTDGYSGADMTNLCREAALGPIRSIPFEQMETITPDQVRPIILQDFEEALHQVRASVSSKDLLLYTEWNQTYGSFGQ